LTRGECADPKDTKRGTVRVRPTRRRGDDCSPVPTSENHSGHLQPYRHPRLSLPLEHQSRAASKMAEHASNPTTEAYLAASQARLNLIFEKFWALQEALQEVTPRHNRHIAEPAKPWTYLHDPAKHLKPPSAQKNRWPSKKQLQL
ncbi:Hypothetical predicted protein, partial [Pelobates cultripes]